MTTWVRIAYAYLRVGVLNELQYRANFWANLFQSILGLATALGGLGVVFYHTDNLGGWRGPELAALVGVFFLIRGAINLIIKPSMEAFMDSVRKGTLDYVLLKPADGQLLVSVQRVSLWSLFDMVLGVGVIVVALFTARTEVGAVAFLAALLTLLNGTLIVYSFYLMLATCAFWFIKIENILVIFTSMYQAGRWPVGIYPQVLQIILTFLVPVAFAVTVPAEALVGRMTLESVALSTLVALLLLTVARWFWGFGIRHYAGASA